MKTTSINDFKDKEIKNTATISGGTGGDGTIDKDKIKPPKHGTGQ
ncbi:hypothetical protein ACFO5T_05980 [Dokdonia genika]|uniref:Uncharacterized protein n=1 Tax=Dokdonia genika TaxID=308113 RepID=A0ABV9L8Y3_9FLAO